MAYNKFRPGTIIEINGAPYLPQGYTVGKLLLLHQVTGEHFRYAQCDGSSALLDDDKFDEMLLSGEIVIKSAPSAAPGQPLTEEAEWTRDQAERLDPEALRKAKICQLLDETGTPNGELAIKRAIDKLWTVELTSQYGSVPGARTIRAWRAKRGRPGDRHPRHMVRRNGRREGHVRADTIASQVLWKCVLDGRKAGRSVRDIHADFAREIYSINEGQHPLVPAADRRLTVCSEQTVRRRFNALESNLTLPSTIEKQANEQDWLGAGKGMTADFAMQRVIIDHTWLDLHVVCPKLEIVLGRPWLTLAIDVKSRAIVGHVITFLSPSVWTVGEVMRRIVLPKRPPAALAKRFPILAKLRGKPTEIITDNAVEFRSHSLEAAARDAGCSVQFCPIKQPRYRAICERAIKTINSKICNGLPGRSLTLNDARRWGYDPATHAVIMLDELEAVANHAVADYNLAPHAGLLDRQPALVFQKDLNRYGINNFADFESFRRDTMQVKQDAQLTPSGVRAFDGLRYHDIEAVPALLNDLVSMEPRRKRRDDATATVQFRFDPADISCIYVWNRKVRKYVELRCAEERYADGMPLWLHEKIREAAKAESVAFDTEDERLVARGQFIQAFRNVDPGEVAASRKRLAELLEIPRIRQVTGNIVNLLDVDPAPVSLGDFISNDRAGLKAIDHEILSSRPEPAKKRASSALQRRRAAAVQAQHETDTPKRNRRLIADKGGYL